MVTSAPSTPSGVFRIPIHDNDEGSTSGECDLMVATSNAGAGDAVAVGAGDDGAAGAEVACASSIEHARAMQAATRRRDFRGNLRAGAGAIEIGRASCRERV